MKHLDMIFSCSSSSSTATLSGGAKPRPTSHHRLGGERKAADGCLSPAVMFRRSSFRLPNINPKGYNSYFQKGRKSSVGKESSDLRRRSAADIADMIKPDLRSTSWHIQTDSNINSAKYFDLLDESTKKTELLRRQDHDLLMQSRHSISLDGSPYPTTSYTARCSRKNQQQVVELRVSIHCKGCEGKVRKHISKMEGVTSVNIDLALKKVTVVGDVTPLGVLASISQVKSAQLWPISPPNSSTSSGSSSSSSFSS
ncbi:protein SODIUM POTASSIUM ROOT DEFECTIVE 3-like [Impatiens glandulifera]|uniref:protein SODIUM POTASSIUM ROOT DEFECTIVE 3-like n=1 Tax=Impatiens glandulifera TaxID=253017 RepID=UPI001FB18586|nr:protein SODIUM POTASSIUM ROOT DEFECTIVE 3-like [Impatiens glandulifera]